ncbi:MAG: DNA mismatch repair endonuclease MutL [Endomicrobiales bacterium]
MTVTVLSEETINKISAGEVIERPANVVKELVENALDAEARSICIDIRQAGKSLIRIADDGRGMSTEDLLLAVKRHATSKIRDFNDVSSVISLGFRGEALPSIASVSHVSIQTQQRSGLSGWELKLKAGRQEVSRSWAGSPGTIIEVSHLFFNTPAREKFLKSETTERNRIVSIVEEMALAWPDCAFVLTSDGKPVLNVPRGQSMTERIADIVGDRKAKDLLIVEAEHPQITMTAFITPRTSPLPTKSFQYLFINGRPINFPKFLTRSLYDAYRENLPTGTHPGAVIYLTVDPGEIDVNIHPTKREVRFSHEQQLYQFFFTAVRKTLTQDGFSPTFTSSLIDNQSAKECTINHHPPCSESDFSPAMRRQTELLYSDSHAANPQPMESELIALGQVFGTYGVAFWNKQLIIIDQHAAAERIRFERYRTQWLHHVIAVQPLLLPLTIDLPVSQMCLIKENVSLLTETGWEIEEFGKTTVRITSVPAILGTASAVGTLFATMIEALHENTKLPHPQRIENIIRKACRASIKAHEPLSREELSRLVTDLFATEMPHTCPHGRPTYYALSEHDLKKIFNRNG